MNIISKINSESRVEATVVYGSHKWYLSQWSLLFGIYKDGIESSEFEFMQAEECKCVLTFYSNSTTFDNDWGAMIDTCALMKIKFLSKFEFLRVQATVSFVDKNMQKILTVKSESTDSVESPLLVYFDKVMTDRSVAEYLQDDTLILFVELHIVKAINTSLVRTNTWASNFSAIARDKFKDMFEMSQFCDVTFKVQDETLSAHKLVLAATSDVFRAMFMTKMKEQKEGTVKIEDVDAKVFKIFLRYMYTGKVEDIGEVVTELIAVANKYQVNDLVKLCETYMMANLQIGNATEYLLTGHRLLCLPLEEEAIKFMKSNTHILTDRAEYKLLFDYPSLVARIFG